MTISASFVRIVLVLLVGIGFSQNGQAQTQMPPAWLGARSIGSGDVGAFGFPLVPDGTGNAYQLGTFSNTTTIAGTVYTSQGSSDAFLAKYDAAGNLLSLRLFSTADYERASNLVVDAAGNVYFSLMVSSPVALDNTTTINAGQYVVCYSARGTATWAQPVDLGGDSIGVDALGHVFVAGLFQDMFFLGNNTLTTPGTGRHGLYLARLSAATGAVESLQMPGYYPPAKGAVFNYYTPAITVAPSGEVFLLNVFGNRIIIGTDTLTTRGWDDVLIAKFTAQGTREWTQQYGGPSIEAVAQAVADASGNLYLTGSFRETASFGPFSAISAGDYDGYLVKYSPQGTAQWVQTGGGPHNDFWNGLTLDTAGNPYITGSFYESARLGSSTLASTGRDDLLVAAYTAAGQLRWVQQAGGSASDEGYDIYTDAAGQVYVNASTQGVCPVGPSTITATARFENFLARLGSTTLAALAARPTTLNFYPNPASSTLHVTGLPVGTRVQVLDALGHLARETTVSAAAQVSVRGLAPGLYALRATDARGQRLAGKVMVE
jgi:hypothetical protein